MPMQQIKLNVSETSTEILVGGGAFGALREHMSAAGLNGSSLVVSQPRVLKAIERRDLGRLPLVTIPDGERAKTMGTVSRLIDRMVSHGLTRQSAIVAVGGGVVGDVAAFAASIYLRGIAVVQVPTTLLAQVDSSVGGKTGVNHRAAKNLIGSFHQPRLVVVDPSLLASLPRRQYSSGLYEALKYGIIRDRALFLRFGRNREAILEREVQALEELISDCLRIKVAVVGADEREGDLRRILNFGHTIGHALETAAGYRRILHGEAVGYGMLAATWIAREMRRISAPQAGRIEEAVLGIARLPRLKGVSTPAVMEAIGHDKKVRDGSVHFVLPRRIGRVEITPDVPRGLVRRIVAEILKFRL